jgi:hypothetical protein
MKYLKHLLMTFSFLFVSLCAQAQIATLDGNWHSPQWKYGYVLKDGMGIATSTNSPNFQIGQNIIQLTATSPNTFTGQQVYTDGKFYKVTATLLPDGRLSFAGEKNVKWVMERIGAPPQASASAGVGAQSQASPEIDTNFTLVNSSAEPIYEFFISSVKSTGWGKDILGESVLMPGFEQPFTAGSSSGCLFDLQVIYGNKAVEERRNLNLCQLERIVFDGRGSTAPAAQPAPSAQSTAPAPSNPNTNTAAQSLTGPQKNAVRAAQSYLNISAFSRDGLIDQLSSQAGNGFNVNDATKAVDSLNVDWNQEAVKSAQQYLKMMGFSCRGLIQQLSSRAGGKFTEPQATFGAQRAGAC